ncbi:MAG: MerR family transcriptional regulator, partial [Anaerolineae bacterium]
MFKIGEFSRLSRVSVRMLRYYDQLGLLKPSQTDPVTGYRYYSAEQLTRLNRILALQDLGFSLQQIGDLLDEELPSAQLLGMLRLKRAEMEQAIQAGQQRLRRLEARMAQLDGASAGRTYDIVLRSVEPQLVASARETVADDERIQAIFHEVEAFVASSGAAR